MRRTANIATFPERLDVLPRMLDSITNQFDDIRIYFNNPDGYTGVTLPDPGNVMWINGDTDLADNGKFFFLESLTEPEYYFTLDDDLKYPPDYADRMVEFLDEFPNVIATHHGRKLVSPDTGYYKGGHKEYRCLGKVYETDRIDVAGTGVSAFRTDTFCPRHLYKHSKQKMADLIFSLEAAKNKVPIMVLPHGYGYIGYLHPADHTTIYEHFRGRDQSDQNEISKQIYNQIYGY